jgi:hypothetical protein
MERRFHVRCTLILDRLMAVIQVLFLRSPDFSGEVWLNGFERVHIMELNEFLAGILETRPPWTINFLIAAASGA